jgi:hypothetical protein
MLDLMDDLVRLVQKLAPGYRPKYSKYYVRLEHDGQVNNFVTFQALKTAVRVTAALSESEETKRALEEAQLEYGRTWVDLDTSWISREKAEEDGK